MKRWKRLGGVVRERVRVFVCRWFHRKDHFCLDDMCAPVLPGARCHFCNWCSRTWHTENPRVSLTGTCAVKGYQWYEGVEANYREDKPDNFQSDGTYTEEDENGVTVIRSQPFDRRKKNA